MDKKTIHFQSKFMFLCFGTLEMKLSCSKWERDDPIQSTTIKGLRQIPPFKISTHDHGELRNQ